MFSFYTKACLLREEYLKADASVCRCVGTYVERISPLFDGKGGFRSVEKELFAFLSCGKQELRFDFSCGRMDVVAHPLMCQDIADVNERAGNLVAGQIAELRIMLTGNFGEKRSSS